MSVNNEIEIENQDENNSKEFSNDLEDEQISDEIFVSNNLKNKNRIINIKTELKEIKNKIKVNNQKIEEIKLNLIKLKEEKNKNKKDIIDLLSKKESIEEIYKNQIFSLKNKKEKIFFNNKEEQSILFNIGLDEFNQINLDKFIEEILSLCEDILDDEFNKNYLRNIIINSYKIFMNNFSKNDAEFIIDNFISKISLYISNQSFGKYLEKNIGIFLRYLMSINIIDEKIEKLRKFVNKQYKDKKLELNEEIKNLEYKNEILSKLFKDKKKILKDIKNEKNDDILFPQNFNFNINNPKQNNNFKNYNENQNNIVDKQININYNANTIINNKNNSIKETTIENGINSKTNKNEIENLNNNDINNLYEKSNPSRLIKGKKIKRELIINNQDNNPKKNISSEDDSFSKNLNYISDDDYETNNSKLNNNYNEGELKLENNLIDIKENNKIIQNKHDRIKKLLEDLALNKNEKNKGNNVNIKIYNKKNIKKNNINKNNKLNNKENSEVNNILEQNQLNNKNSKIKENTENNDDNRKDEKNNENSNLIINKSSKDNLKNKNIKIGLKDIINNKSHDFIFNKQNKSDQSPDLKEKQEIIINNNGINKNEEKKDIFNEININNLEQSDIEIENNNKNSKDTKTKKNNKVLINKKILQNLIKSIKGKSVEDKEKNQNIEIKSNIQENTICDGENNNFVEKIINKILVQKAYNLNANNNNLLKNSDNKNSKEKSAHKYLDKFITKNNIINNNINNNNEITLPIPNQPVSNRISKLNLNIFITQNKENNGRLPELNILTEQNIIRNRNQKNHSTYFKKNGFETDNVINGLKKENNINSPEENVNNEEKINLKKNNVLRKLNLNKKIYEERNRILINREFFSTNNRNSKRIRKIRYTANKSNEITDFNQDKQLKNQYSLFYNTHDFTINNNHSETINKSNKKSNQLLTKNFSNLKSSNNKQKILKDPNYKYSFYPNKINNGLLKTNHSNNSYSNNKLNKRNKIFIHLNNLNKKQNLKLSTNTYNNSTKNNIKNKNKKNQTIKVMKNQNESFNYTLNTNINTISNNSINNALNKIIFVNKKRIINHKNKQNELKKLLEKNLRNIIPNNSLNFNPKKIFAEGVMESFCYFKILEKDSPKFNPLESCAISPESLGYSEGYISIDVILGQFRIIPKNIISKNIKFNDNKSEISNNSLSMSEYTLFNNGNNVFRFEIDKNEKKNCIRIDLKNISQIKIKQQMQDIIKIRKIFLKYNSNHNYDNGKTRKKLLSINQLLYTKEISEINMDQNQKIKAALCNFFAFTIFFGNNKINKVECVFINFDLFNIWIKCLNMIAENNNKSKNSLDSHRGLLHKKNNSNIYLNTNN